MGFSVIHLTATNPAVDIGKLIPARQRYQTKAICLGGKAPVSFIFDVIVDESSGNILINAGGNDLNYEGVYDSAMRLVRSHDTYQNGAMVQAQEYDRREAYRGTDNRVTLNFYRADKLIRSSLLTWDDQTVETNGLNIYLQGMALQGTPRLDVNMLSKFRGAKYPVNIKLLADEEVGKIVITENFKALFGASFLKDQKLLIYELSLAGVYGVLYPHKFYFAYQKEPLGHLAGSWGGTGIDEEYYRFEFIAL
jgi:hypothetical protein